MSNTSKIRCGRIVEQLIMGDRVERLLEVHKAHRPIEWLLVLAYLVHQYSEIRDLISCPPSLSESRLFICNFRFGLHLVPFQYDPKKDLACMGDKSNCSVICTLFKIAYFLGSGMNVENVHSSSHSLVSQIATHILCIMSSTVSPALNSSAGTSSGPVALRLAV